LWGEKKVGQGGGIKGHFPPLPCREKRGIPAAPEGFQPLRMQRVGKGNQSERK